jgi:NAD(P)H dehydrogenase (quinone)
VAEHLKTLTRLVAGGRYDVVTDQLETLLGRRPKTVRWALESNPRIRKVAVPEPLSGPEQHPDTQS